MINYPYYYQEDLFDQDEIIAINKILEEHKVGKDEFGTEYKKADSYNVVLPEEHPFLDKVNFRTHTINRKEFGYDLYDLPITYVNLNHYSGDKNDYDWHIDCNPYGHKNDLKLTFIINISLSEYTGGELLLSPGKTINIPELDVPGNAILFPGFTSHKVTPVTSGKRTSLSVWFHGPGFK